MTNRTVLAGLAGLVLTTLSSAAFASPAVTLDSAVFVERITPQSGRMLGGGTGAGRWLHSHEIFVI